MHSRRKRILLSQINVVPYIDVMLVLLIIFMVTAPMLTTGVRVDLPQISSQPLPVEINDALVFSVDSQGRYYIEQDRSDQAVQPDQVSALVTKVLAEVPQTQVMVRGDKTVSYGHVVALMVLLQQAGAQSVGLVTEQ